MGAFTKDGIKRKQEAISWVIGALEKRKGEIAEIMREKMTIRSDNMELLTTGQMIDQLKVGEVAQLKNIYSEINQLLYRNVTKIENGDICWAREDGLVDKNVPLILYGHTVNWEWNILLNYVSFEDAKKAFIDGKNIALRDSNGDILHLFELDSEVMIQLTFNDFIHGKWTIEE